MSDLPYRSSIAETPAEKKEQVIDERELSTLHSVRKLLANQVEALNSFKTLESNLTAEEMLIEVKSRQMVFNILSPLLTAVNDAIEKVKNQGK